MCLPMSTVHHTHSEMGSVITQFEQYRDLPSKSLENSSGLTFLDYCALSLSLWLLYYIHVCQHPHPLCWVITGPLE